MSESVIVPAERDVRGTLDSPESDRCVLACPPHPGMGGDRSDSRIQAVSDALECACLRFDYGPWDEGYGELSDTRNAYAWARKNYDRVSLFGYSFGGCLALVAAARESTAGVTPESVVALSPAAELAPEIDAVAAIADIDCPVGVVYGERDTTVDAAAVAERVRDHGGEVVVLSADHHFVGQTDKTARKVVSLL
ncbi:dienelactone hydrolase family protein [Natronomonas sp. F2-12]|jgi:alpha/beta superfamily hydrolase|uniref:Dienelactone hydrolase family protein n=1 Tax=Natronomonas aquatica TaxID=2841590 RepID=A0A9R1CNU8_9EURY|nr:dienelactone hydrolase family protein [Natronomonas aquatica]MCQ4332254.1 dienelactone hydrolase family protein [Natronomonas aquatica]